MPETVIARRSDPPAARQAGDDCNTNSDSSSKGDERLEKTRRQITTAARQGATQVRQSPRLRAIAAPWAASAGMYASATVAAPAWGAFPTFAGGLTVTGLVAGWARWRVRTATGMWRAYPSAAAVTAAGWQTAAYLGHPSLAGLVAATAAAAIPWWHRHRPTVPDVQTEQLMELTPSEPEPEPVEETPWQVDKFHQYLASKGCPLPGTWVTDFEHVPFGFRLIVNWPEGRNHDELWGDNVRKVARSIYGVPPERVITEQLPGRPQTQARMIVLTSDPVQGGVTWQGQDPDSGIVNIGIYTDGYPMQWRFWTEEGACHGLVCGCSGSGKSKALNLLVIAALQAPWICTWFLDGQRGASAPTVGAYVDRTGMGPEATLARLRELKAIMDDRSDRMPTMPWTDKKGRTRQGVGKIVPSRELPQIVAFLDEAQIPLRDSNEAATIVNEIVTTGRKVGVSLVLTTQVPSAGSLNSITGMREQLKAFNTLVLRLTEKFTSGMANAAKLPIPPDELPSKFDNGKSTSGLGYKPDDRAVTGRAAFIPDGDEDDAEQYGRDELDWAERGVPGQLEPEAVRAMERAAPAADGGQQTVSTPNAAADTLATSARTTKSALDRIAAMQGSN